MSICDTNTSSQTFTPFTVASCFIIDCQQQPMLHVIHSLLQLADMNPLLITAALFQDFIVIGLRY